MDSRTRASGTVVDPRASLAMWLRTGRTQRNLSLADVARITKIQARILEKLENGNLDGLPADVFVKGFVRSFAKCVGLDEREALDRLGAAQSGTATTVAQAFVDSMSVRLVQPSALGVEPASSSNSLPIAASSSPSIPMPAIEVVEILDVAPLAAIAAPSIAAPVLEILDVAALAPITTPVVEAADASAEPAKKKRAPRKKNPSAAPAPRSRKKKPAVGETAEASSASSTELVVASITELVSAESTSTESVAASSAASEIITVAAHADESQDGLQVAASEERISARDIAIVQTISADEAVAVSVEDAIVEPQDFAEGSRPHKSGQIEIVDLSAEELESTACANVSASGTWQPTMPPLSTSPSVPWRRAQTPQQAAYVVPHMVIDDADPDSADRQREREERANREHSRLSFLPAILLDREDRSARQGGLTLAVIILLIAATLTLSYLMRRPSARGDGVTQLDGSSELLGSIDAPGALA